MSPWPFIVAAYAIAIAAIAGLAMWSFVHMRSAERQAEDLRSTASTRGDARQSA